jgi:phosphate:Na+ symporter
MLTTFQNPVLALLAGFVFTAIIQSSSATMGLLVTMHLSGVPIPFETSTYIILGTNIGTCITSVIASIPASRDSKRAAIFHVIYDIIGCFVFGPLIYMFPSILRTFQAVWAESARQVAMFHTIYNVATLLLPLPFVKWIALLMQKIVPLREEEIDETYDRKLVYLDSQTVLTPTLAVVNAHLEICRMGDIAYGNLVLALESFFQKSEEKANKVLENEKIADYLNHHIAYKLIEINNMPLSTHDAERVGEMFMVLTDIERIGDHAENIAEYALIYKESNLKFSDTAIEELWALGNVVMIITEEAIDTYEREDRSQLVRVDYLEKYIDQLSLEYVENHVDRLKRESCEPQSGVVFTDMIVDLERVADHANNIAFSIEFESKRDKKANRQ